ncbi:unnamed protein product [Somion occarium]
MAFASTAELTVAVSGSGAFGFFGAGFDTSAQLKETIQTVRTKLNLPKGVPVPMGFGFIGWILEMTESSDDPRLATILDELPVAIWFAFGVDLGKYVAQVRAHDAKRDHKTVVFVIVNSATDAVRAANEWGVDVIVAQGNEAGGHGGSISPPLFDLLPDVLAALPNGPPVVAAGGVATGAQVASLLALGVSGVVLGTRFLFTNECRYTDQIKSVLVDADLRATQRSLCFDEVNRTNYWPPLHDGRAIANQIWDDFTSGLSLEERLKKHDESNAKGEKDRLVIWAGVGAGLTKTISPAADVVKELHEGTLKAIKATSALLG